jgi:hypothetical protein
MKKVIRLTESELVSVIKKIISEQTSKSPKDVFDELQDGVTYDSGNFKMDETSITLGNKKLNLGSDWAKLYNSEIKGEKVSEVHKFGKRLHINVDKSTKRNPMESKIIRFEIKNPQ